MFIYIHRFSLSLYIYIYIYIYIYSRLFYGCRSSSTLDKDIYVFIAIFELYNPPASSYVWLKRLQVVERVEGDRQANLIRWRSCLRKPAGLRKF